MYDPHKWTEREYADKIGSLMLKKSEGGVVVVVVVAVFDTLCLLSSFVLALYLPVILCVRACVRVCVCVHVCADPEPGDAQHEDHVATMEARTPTDPAVVDTAAMRHAIEQAQRRAREMADRAVNKQ